VPALVEALKKAGAADIQVRLSSLGVERVSPKKCLMMVKQ